MRHAEENGRCRITYSVAKKRRCRQSCRGTRSTEIHDRTDARSKACFRASFSDAEQWLKASYGASIWLDNVLRLIESFTAVLPAEGFFYLADFEEFLRESVLEDTFERTASSIVVSTIHKAKGREFDHVYILYASRSFEDDDARRKLYVGMTRARFDLTIHYRGALLNQTLPETVHPSVDKTAYNAPDELTLTLTHEDVWLD